MHESIRKQKSSLYNSELVDRCRMAKIYQKSIEYDIKKLVFKHNESQKHCFVIMEIEDELKK